MRERERGRGRKCAKSLRTHSFVTNNTHNCFRLVEFYIIYFDFIFVRSFFLLLIHMTQQNEYYIHFCVFYIVKVNCFLLLSPLFSLFLSILFAVGLYDLMYFDNIITESKCNFNTELLNLIFFRIVSVFFILSFSACVCCCCCCYFAYIA